MRKTLLTAVLAATSFAASAAEGPMSYTYAEVGYTHLKINSSDLGDPKGDGGYIRGSIAIAPQVYLFGGWSQVSKSYHYHYSDGTSEKDKYTISQPQVGIGYHMPFTDALDFVADLSYQRLDGKIKASYEGESITYKDHLNLVRVDAGVRGKPSARTEAWLKAGYFDGSDVDYLFDSQFVGTAGLQFNITPQWGIVGEVQVYDGATQASVGVRASF